MDAPNVSASSMTSDSDMVGKKSNRTEIPEPVQRLLMAKSGGYCQNPACNQDLFRQFESGRVSTIRELAHIIGQSTKGPRGDSEMPRSHRDSYENIILLCPTCHTLVDTNPGEYPVEMLIDWKIRHESVIESCFSVPEFDNYAALQAEISALLMANRVIHSTYGPESDAALNPLSDAVEQWHRHILADIIPNNRRVAELLQRNKHLLSVEQKLVAARFLVHKEGFEYNHLSGEKNASVPMFPKEMHDLFQ